METEISVTYDCQRGIIAITVQPDSSTIGFHWKPHDSARQPYYNGPIRPDHVEEDIQRALADGRVWMTDSELEELPDVLSKAARFVWESIGVLMNWWRKKGRNNDHYCSCGVHLHLVGSSGSLTEAVVVCLNRSCSEFKKEKIRNANCNRGNV